MVGFNGPAFYPPLDYSCLLLNILHRETLFCWSLVRTQEKNDRWVSLGAHLEEGGLGGVVPVCWGSLLSLSWKKWVNFRCRLKPDFLFFFYLEAKPELCLLFKSQRPVYKKIESCERNLVWHLYCVFPAFRQGLTIE